MRHLGYSASRLAPTNPLWIYERRAKLLFVLKLIYSAVHAKHESWICTAKPSVLNFILKRMERTWYVWVLILGLSCYLLDCWNAWMPIFHTSIGNWVITVNYKLKQKNNNLKTRLLLKKWLLNEIQFFNSKEHFSF